MKEEWKAIEGYRGFYEVSDQGHVRSWRKHGGRAERPKLRALVPIKNGYLTVMFWDGSRKLKYVHDLVLSSFDRQKHDGEECRHLDGDPTNNKLSNLAWGTKKQNEADKLKHGTSQHGERNPSAKLTNAQANQIRQRRQNGEPLKTIAAEFGVAQSCISRIANGKRRAIQ